MRKLCIVLVIIFSCFFTSCKPEKERPTPPTGIPYTPPFSTKYTEEEHIKNIEDKTRHIYKQEFAEGKIVDMSVDIVYSIDLGNPEYFVIEIRFLDEFSADNTIYHLDDKYVTTCLDKHLIGYIENDKYYMQPFYACSDPKQAFAVGKSPYSLFCEPNDKKYFGIIQGESVYAVKRGDDLIRIASNACLKHSGAFDIHREEYKEYTKNFSCRDNEFSVIPKEEYANYKRRNRGELARIPYKTAYEIQSEWYGWS